MLELWQKIKNKKQQQQQQQQQKLSL